MLEAPNSKYKGVSVGSGSRRVAAIQMCGPEIPKCETYASGASWEGWNIFKTIIDARQHQGFSPE
jgi:hypothetical protein